MQSEPIDADAALTLLRDRIAALEGCEEASDWTTSSTATLVALVRDQHTVAEAEDVCLLRSVKDAFKSAGISDLSAREEAVRLWWGVVRGQVMVCGAGAEVELMPAKTSHCCMMVSEW